jgi:hypothetical protein
MIKFSAWSLDRIRAGKKHCTSRKHWQSDSRILGVAKLPWWFIRDRLYELEGAGSPEELQRVMNKLCRHRVEDDETFFVFFMDFRKEINKEEK